MVKIKITPEWIEKYFKLRDQPFKLYPYQVKFIMDKKSKRKIVLKARQTGFSTIIALEALIKCFARRDRVVLIVSVAERQALEIMNKIKKFLTKGMWLSYEGTRLLEVIRETKKEIWFRNGSRIISLPNNPQAARGYTADDIYLDEYAHLENADQMLMAIEPSLSRGGNLTLISTPAGKIGKFYDIWKDAKKLKYSRHKIHWKMCPDKTYHKQILQFKKNMDAFSFQQEYELQFLSEGFGFFPPGLVRNCIDENLKPTLSDEKNFVQFGMDVGKIKSNSALVIIEKIEEREEGKPKIKVIVRRVILWRLGTNYDLIKSDLKRYMSAYGPSRVNIDSTGVGERYVEEIRKEEGAVIIPVKFSTPMKERMFSQLRTLFENKQIRVPDNNVLLNQLFQFERTITESGTVRFKGKHDDIVMALGLSTLDLMRPRPYMGIR